VRFGLSAEQESFDRALGDVLAAAEVPAAVRAWAAGEPGPGLALWSALAEMGVTALRVPENHGGVGATALDMVVAFTRLGYHGVPGPWVESAVLAPAVLSAVGDPDKVLGRLVDGAALVTLAAPPLAPYALDTGVAERLYILEGGVVWRGIPQARRESVDRARLLTVVGVGDRVAQVGAATAERGLDEAALACAAQLLGAGRRLLDDSVAYVGVRRQFGRVIGQYQALKHALADIRVALDFAAPLLHGAAEALDADDPGTSLEVSAAKVATAAAATRAARTALQVHGAIGYTEEFDLSIWLTKVRALAGAWGTSSWHRQRVLDELAERDGPRAAPGLPHREVTRESAP
jgi:alkylation response protein AidB-like acyl-CoA dehydrogenase